MTIIKFLRGRSFDQFALNLVTFQFFLYTFNENRNIRWSSALIFSVSSPPLHPTEVTPRCNNFNCFLTLAFFPSLTAFLKLAAGELSSTLMRVSRCAIQWTKNTIKSMTLMEVLVGVISYSFLTFCNLRDFQISWMSLAFLWISMTVVNAKRDHRLLYRREKFF